MPTKTKIDYKTYLASREWRLKRKELFTYNGDKNCERCRAPATQVHHVTYNSIGNECVISDIQAVCRDCHEYLSAERKDDPAGPKIIDRIERNGMFPSGPVIRYEDDQCLFYSPSHDDEQGIWLKPFFEKQSEPFITIGGVKFYCTWG